MHRLTTQLVCGEKQDPHSPSAYGTRLDTLLRAMSDYLELASGPVHYVDYGGTGRPFLLVHGLGGSVANWDLVGPALVTHGHVIAIDLPGFGLSPPRSDWSLSTHATAIAETAELLGAPVTLIGNSLGGLLSEIVAARQPHLVDALVLISPATPPRLPDPNIDWEMAWRLLLNATPGVGLALSRWLIRTLSPRELVNESLQRITHEVSRVPPEMIEAFVDVARRRSHFPWAVDAIPRTGAAIRSLFLRPSRFVATIRDIKAPTLVVQGVDDPIVSPKSVEWMCSLRLDWTLVQLEDTGHTPQIDAAERTLAVVEPWLASHVRQDIAV